MIRALLFVSSLVACFVLPSGAVAQTTTQSATLAQKIVNDVLQAKANDIVVINADVAHMDIVNQLVTRLRQIGAYGITNIGSDEMARLYFRYVPARFDSQPPTDLIRLASIASSVVSIDSPYDPAVARGIPASRLSAENASYLAYPQYLLKRGIPNVDIGNGIMPSAATAAYYGVSETALSNLFWSGVNADYSQIRRDSQRMSAMTNGSHTVHITAPNGTNFTFRTVSGSAVMNTGTISAEDRRKGGVAMQKQLPAGDVYVLPAAGSANGTLVLGTFPLRTAKVAGMRIRIVNGKVASMNASSGGDLVKAQYNAATAGRDEFAFADFGVNRSMTLGPGDWGLGPSMAAGIVSVAVGNNLAQGGSNRSSLFLGSLVQNATVTVDGRPVITNGRLAY